MLGTAVGYAGGTLENPTYRALGDHTETIEIAEAMLARIGGRLGRERPRLTEAAVELLSAQPWPGNGTQLKQLLQRGG